jgi:hypothetical protein
MHLLHSLFYLKTALHVSSFTVTHLQEYPNVSGFTVTHLQEYPNVSGVTVTHLQEYKTTVATALVSFKPYCFLVLSWKSWNWFECVVGGLRHPQHTQTIPSLPR